MKKRIKKGTIKKSETEMLLIAGSKISTISEDGEVINYILGSDIAITLENNARLFPVRR